MISWDIEAGKWKGLAVEQGASGGSTGAAGQAPPAGCTAACGGNTGAAGQAPPAGSICGAPGCVSGAGASWGGLATVSRGAAGWLANKNVEVGSNLAVVSEDGG